MAIDDGAVDGVHEGAGQIADEGGHGHGRACDFAGTSTSSMGAKKTARML